RSRRTSREKRARRSLNAATQGSTRPTRMPLITSGTRTRSTGPSPLTAYAIDTPSASAYRMSGNSPLMPCHSLGPAVCGSTLVESEVRRPGAVGSALCRGSPRWARRRAPRWHHSSVGYADTPRRPGWRVALLRSAAGALVLAVGLAACGMNINAAGNFKPRHPGALTVATGEIPLAGMWTGTAKHPTGGFEYELAKALAKRFGLERVDVVVIPFNRLVRGDMGGRRAQRSRRPRPEDCTGAVVGRRRVDDPARLPRRHDPPVRRGRAH